MISRRLAALAVLATATESIWAASVPTPLGRRAPSDPMTDYEFTGVDPAADFKGGDHSRRGVDASDLIHLRGDTIDEPIVEDYRRGVNQQGDIPERRDGREERGWGADYPAGTGEADETEKWIGNFYRRHEHDKSQRQSHDERGLEEDPAYLPGMERDYTGYTQGKLWATGPNAETRQNGGWTKQIEYSGQTFFDGFNFFSEPDPSHGLVQYVDAGTAFSEGLVFWTRDGVPGIQAEHWAHTQDGVPRQSVRISTKALFQGGLFLVDLAVMPWGCGVWPAVWLLGYDQEWPYAGEIDIVEGIMAQTNNQMTIHTPPGCNLNQTPGLFSGKVANPNCDSTMGNSGCSIVSSSNTSFGMPFNQAGGGVFGLLWDGDGLKFYNWNRDNIPDDIKTEQPNVLGWGQPVAAWSAQGCDPWSFFHPQQLLLNIDLCGDWAGNTYGSYSYCPGTCSSYISDPNNLNNTVMLINSIKVFQQPGHTPIAQQVNTVKNQTGAAGAVGRARGKGNTGAGKGAASRSVFLLPTSLIAGVIVLCCYLTFGL